MKRNTQKIKEQDNCPPNQTKEEDIGPVAGLFDCRLVAAVAGFCKTRRQTRCRQADEAGTENDMNDRKCINKRSHDRFGFIGIRNALVR